MPQAGAYSLKLYLPSSFPLNRDDTAVATMAAPASVKIEKVVSAPADPSAPSILTMLAPEIRNSIYEHLFKRDEPVLLHDPDAYRRSLVIAHGANQRFRTALWNNSFSDLSASDLENIDCKFQNVPQVKVCEFTS